MILRCFHRSLVLLRQRGNAVAVAAGNGRRHGVGVGILPAENGRFGKDGDVGVLGLRAFKSVFDAAEVSFPIAVDDQDLADCEADGFPRRPGRKRKRARNQEESELFHESVLKNSPRI